MVGIVLGVVLGLVGLALAVVGALGLAGRLQRNRWAGVRTPGSLSSAEAFTVANRAAGPGTLTAGVLLVLGGVAVAGLDGVLRLVVGLLFAVGGFVVVASAGALGARAVALPVPAGPHARCADCTGCELMDSLKA